MYLSIELIEIDHFSASQQQSLFLASGNFPHHGLFRYFFMIRANMRLLLQLHTLNALLNRCKIDNSFF